MAKKKRIAVFDFDGTITRKDTFVQFAIFARGWLRTSFTFIFFSPLIILMKLRLIDNGKVKQLLFSSLFKGMSIEQFRKLGHDFAKQIDTFLNNKTIERLSEHQNNGDSIIVITASLEEWVRPWCEIHDIKTVIATQTEVKNGTMNGRLSTKNCYGPEKVNRLKEVLGDLSDYHITAYGDSYGDRDIMEIADKVIWV